MKKDHMKVKLQKEEQSSDLRKVPRRPKQDMKGSARMSTKEEIAEELRNEELSKVAERDLEQNEEVDAAMDCWQNGPCERCKELQEENKE